MTSDRIIYPPLASHFSLRQPLTAGEQRVFDLFNQQLPAHWEIYIQPHLNGLRPDFVLLNPKAGIGVFEVKDWNLGAMRYFVKKDQWGFDSLWAERDGERFCIQSQNPITKVKLYKEEIFKLYCPRIQANFGWAAITAGVIFPFAKAESVKALLAPFQKAQEKERYANYQPISGIEAISSGDLSSIFPESKRSNSALMSESLAQDLRGWLVEPDFASTQRRPLVLDKNQRDLAETRTSSGYRRIKGPAGSGKSLVLAARAAKLANEGKSVLIATFNITLWHYLRDLIVRALDEPRKLMNIRLSHFHYWCKHVCYQVGWGQRYANLWQNDKEFVLNEGMARLAGEAIAQPGAVRYDAILVDEGQDYRPLWWNVLRKALRPEGEMLLVADATQDIYGTASAWTDDVMKGAGFRGSWAKLSVSYRLPPDALELARLYAEAFLPKDTIDLPEPEQGSLALYPCHLRWVQCDPLSAQETCCGEVLRLMQQTGKNGLANADITILVAELASGKGIVERLSEYYIRAVNTFGEDHQRQKMGFYMGDARVKATTMHSFKGWETRLLVVFLADAYDPSSLALIYAALTRLKRSTEGSWLTVVCAAHKLLEFGKKFPDFQIENTSPIPPIASNKS